MEEEALDIARAPTITPVFLAGITRDARGSDGRRLFEFDVLDEARSVECSELDAADGELSAEVVGGLHALLIASSGFRVSRKTIEGAGSPTRHS